MTVGVLNDKAKDRCEKLKFVTDDEGEGELGLFIPRSIVRATLSSFASSRYPKCRAQCDVFLEADFRLHVHAKGICFKPIEQCSGICRSKLRRIWEVTSGGTPTLRGTYKVQGGPVVRIILPQS